MLAQPPMVMALLDTSKVIVGATGSGKTVTAKDEVQQLLDQRRHVVVIDPTGVWWGMRSNAAGDGAGFDLPIFGGEHGDVPILPDQGAAIARIVLEQRVSAIVDLKSIDNSRDWRRFMHEFVAELRRGVKGNFHLIVDEADEFAAERPVDDVGFALRENLIWIAKRGRAQGFVPTWITQRTAEIAKAVISQAQTIVAHQLIAPSDLKAIDDYLKGHGSADTRKAVMSSLPELAIGERWIYSPRLRILECGFTPPLTTFDSSRTPAPGEQLVEPRTLAELDVTAIRAALAPPATSAEPESRKSGNTDFDRLLAVRDEALAAADRRIAEQDSLIERLRATIGNARLDLSAIERSARDAIALLDTGASRQPAEVIQTESAATTPSGRDARAAEGVSASDPGDRRGGPRLPAAAGTPDQRLAPRLQALLDWTHWSRVMFGDRPLRRELLAQLLGRHPRSKGFLNDLGELRGVGLIEYAGEGGVALTTAGWSQATPVEMPATPAALRDHLATKLLTPAQRKLFGRTVVSWPHAIAREHLAEHVGHHPRTKSFLNDLGRLRGLGLVTYPDAGGVRAADFLMRKS